MNSRTTRWLIVLALALLAFIFFYERGTLDTDQQQVRTTRVLPELVVAEIIGVEITRGTNLSFSVERRGEQWQCKAPVVYPARARAVEELLETLRRLDYRSQLTAQEVLAQTNGLAAFGLEPPAARLVLRRAGERVELRLGARTPLASQFYLQVVGRDGLFTVEGGVLEALPASWHDWRDRALIGTTGLEVDRVEVRPSTNGFEVVRPPTNRVWQMTKPLLTRANSAKLDFLLGQIQLATVASFVADDPRADLEPYGLQPPERELVLAQGTNDWLVLQIGKSPTNNPGLVHLRLLGHTNVVLGPRAVFDPWLASFREFCDRRLMVFRPEDVDRVEVRADEPFTLQRGTNEVWRITEPFAALADPVLVLELLANLAELEFLEFEKEVATDFTSYGLAPPRRQYILKGTVSNPLGAPTNRVLAQLDLGNPTGPKLFARRSLENSVVTTVDNGRLPRAAFQLRDRRIWNVSTNQITSITVQQQGRTRKLLRTGPAQWVQAPGTGGAAAAQNFILEEAAYRLGQLRAETWVAQGAAALERYGIPATDHQISLEVSAGTQPQTLTLRLGRLAPSRRPYAAVVLPEVADPVIFEIPLPTYELILSDLTLFLPPPGN